MQLANTVKKTLRHVSISDGVWLLEAILAFLFLSLDSLIKLQELGMAFDRSWDLVLRGL